MWPSQYWGALRGSPRSPCLRRNLKCWESAFPPRTRPPRNAPTVLRIASPPRSRHGYGSHVAHHIALLVYSFAFFSHCNADLSPRFSRFCSLGQFSPFGLTQGSSVSDLTSLFVPFPQDENSSGCNQKADLLQRMLSREQQELQVCITITRS